MHIPEEFVAAIRRLLQSETADFLSALQEDLPVSIRLNPYKTARNPLACTQASTAVPWTEFGYYLPFRPAFTFDPLFHVGYYYVQEAASMFVEYAARQIAQAPISCLDLCAAPGGKSLALLAALPEGSLLVSNEIVRSRANVLAETLTKCGNPNVFVANNAPSDFAALPHFFDMVVVDAPCSGEGMFRKDEGAINEWSLANVEMCAARQRTILSEMWSTLKPGGYLLYSTCTFNREENEDNALWIARTLGAEFVQIPVDAAWNISSAYDDDAICYRFFPHKTIGEGFCISILRKSFSEENTAVRDKKNKMQALALLKDNSSSSHFLNNPEEFRVFEENNRIFALPDLHHEKMLLLRKKLNMMMCGVEMGNRKGRDVIPAHALAMSNALRADAFPRCELSFVQAVAYLQGEMLVLNGMPKGFVLLTYQGEPLGYVKNIGNRANNLYPNPWRIRSRNIPETLNFPFQNQ